MREFFIASEARQHPSQNNRLAFLGAFVWLAPEYISSLVRAVIPHAGGIVEDQLKVQKGAVCVVFGPLLKQQAQPVHEGHWFRGATCEHRGRQLGRCDIDVQRGDVACVQVVKLCLVH